MKIPLEADFPVEKQPRPDVARLAGKIVEKASGNGMVSAQAPTVTVVTAVFNAIKDKREAQLRQCLDSVQAQVGTSIEHLIVDGASTDGTVELIRNYANANIPIRLLSEADSGIYDAMNRGLWLARGKYVIFLNSDDYYSSPDGLADSVRHLEETGADFSYAPIQVLSETTDQPVEHLLNHPNVNIIFLEMPFSHQSIMLRREAMLEINGFDLRYRSGADYDSILRLIFTGHRACFVPTVFVAFRLGGFSFVNMTQSQREVGMIFSRLYKKYLNVDLTPEEGTRIYLSKQGPKKLRQRQFGFAKATFGDAISAMHDHYEDSMTDDLFKMQYRLQAIKNRQGMAVTLRHLVLLVCSSPGLLCRFLFFYIRFYCKLGRVGAGKRAFLELLCREQKKREKKLAAARGKSDQPVIPSLPQLGIGYQDYWCTNGLFTPEPWGAWTGRIFSVFCKLPDDYLHQEVTVEIFIGGYVFPESPKRIVDVVVNDRKITTLTLENYTPQPYRFKIPADAVGTTILDIDFIADQAFSLNALGKGEDTRELSMAFQKLLIRKCDASGNEPQAPADRAELEIGFLNHFNRWWVGGITYFKNLFQAMATTESPKLKPFIFPSPDELADCLKPYVSFFPFPPPTLSNAESWPTAGRYHVDILSHLNGNQIAEGRDGIAWIADFQHVHLPEMFDAEEIAFRNHSYHALISQNRIVCLSSRDAMEDFKKYAPEAAHKARCLHFVSIPDPGLYPLPENEGARIRRDRRLPERYFYVPNQFWKHKNHIAVLQAVAMLKRSGIDVHVVFSGNSCDARFPHYFGQLQAFCKENQIEENIHILGLIPLKEVYFLMRDSLAIINPSKFEGWSSSVEEAKSIGKTVILSNLNVHYEQMPPHGSYFPCDDPEWLADLMRRAWCELSPGPDLEMEKIAREELPRRIKQFGKDFQRIVLDALENKNSEAMQAQNEPIVTVVTVVRDLAGAGQKEAFIRNLKSVAAQRGVAVEHLIVDESEGQLAAWQNEIETYACRVVEELHHGVPGAMNRGAIHSCGKYVTFLALRDAYTADDFLQRSVAALEKGNGDFSYAPTPEKPDERACWVEMPFALSSMLFERKALYSVAVFNDTLIHAADHDLVLRLILAGKRAVKVQSDGICVAQEDERDCDAAQRECALIYFRRYGKLWPAMTVQDGARIFAERQLPDALNEILQPYFIHTFGDNQQ